MKIEKGTLLTRVMGSFMDMTVEVQSVLDGVIDTGHMKFDLATGYEIDEKRGWTPEHKRTYIKEIRE